MKDYLEIYKKFSDIKDIKDYIDEVINLRNYYNSMQYEKMQEHINELTSKYVLETLVWNIMNPCMPLTYEQSYQNAENFMRGKGAELIIEKVIDYATRLSREEQELVESLAKPAE